MARRGGRVPDDWIETGRWRSWGAPTGGAVELAPGDGRQLRALLAGQRSGAPLPLPVVLLGGDDGVAVAAGGQVVGRLADGTAQGVSARLREAGRPRMAVAGMIRPAAAGAEFPDLALWLDRRLRPGFEGLLIRP